jgi:hypothetical protein
MRPNPTILEIRNDYEDVFHIGLEAQVPEGVAVIKVDPSALGKDPVTTLKSREPTEPLELIVTTIGRPNFQVGDSLPIQIFYDHEVVERDGRKIPLVDLVTEDPPKKPN